MSWIKSAAIAIWLRAHSDLVFRGFVSLAIFWVINSIYVKYEAVLLVTNPEKLFIPLYIYTFILLGLLFGHFYRLDGCQVYLQQKRKLRLKNHLQTSLINIKKLLMLQVIQNSNHLRIRS